MGYGVRSVGYGVWDEECGTRSVGCGVRSVGCGVRSVDCGVQQYVVLCCVKAGIRQLLESHMPSIPDVGVAVSGRW